MTRKLNNPQVYFCSPSPRPLTFRRPTREDYLSSYLREHVLQVLPEREVRPELILGGLTPEQEEDYILTDEHNPLGAWQDKGALDHWKGKSSKFFGGTVRQILTHSMCSVMRRVLPDYVWNTY